MKTAHHGRLWLLLLSTASLIQPVLAGKRLDASEKYPPRWLQQLPASTNGSCYFVKAEALADTRTQAKDQVIFDLMEQVAIDRNVKVSDMVTIDIETERGTGNQMTDYQKRTHATSEIKQESDEITLRYKVADSYWEEVTVNGRRQYRYYNLYQVARPQQPAQFDPVTFTTRYGASGLWRSAIVPGWGQMYKGVTGKGWMFLGGEIGLVGGLVATESLRQHYIHMTEETRNIEHRRIYRSRSRNMATARNVCIAGAAALYVWNLIDATVAPGAKRIIANGNRPLAVVPYASAEDSGLSVSFHF